MFILFCSATQIELQRPKVIKTAVVYGGSAFNVPVLRFEQVDSLDMIKRGAFRTLKVSHVLPMEYSPLNARRCGDALSWWSDTELEQLLDINCFTLWKLIADMLIVRMHYGCAESVSALRSSLTGNFSNNRPRYSRSKWKVKQYADNYGIVRDLSSINERLEEGPYSIYRSDCSRARSSTLDLEKAVDAVVTVRALANDIPEDRVLAGWYKTVTESITQSQEVLDDFDALLHISKFIECVTDEHRECIQEVQLKVEGKAKHEDIHQAVVQLVGAIQCREGVSFDAATGNEEGSIQNVFMDMFAAYGSTMLPQWIQQMKDFYKQFLAILSNNKKLKDGFLQSLHLSEPGKEHIEKELSHMDTDDIVRITNVYLSMPEPFRRLMRSDPGKTGKFGAEGFWQYFEQYGIKRYAKIEDPSVELEPVQPVQTGGWSLSPLTSLLPNIPWPFGGGKAKGVTATAPEKEPLKKDV